MRKCPLHIKAGPHVYVLSHLHLVSVHEILDEGCDSVFQELEKHVSEIQHLRV